MTTHFQDWVDMARAVSVMDAASMVGAKLKRAGQEFKGPCPMGCSTKDGFIVTPSKNLFLCRKGDAHGDSIELVMHTTGRDFKAAVEFLTGTPPPDGRSGQIDPMAAQRAAERRKQAEREQRRRDQEEQRKATYKANRAHQIWREGEATAGTMAEAYSRNRCIDGIASISSLRFHPRVWNEDVEKPIPALIGLVIGPDKSFKGIWRIFLQEGGEKANVPQVKKGLGSPKGGAVWIATKEESTQPVWGVCEGIETALSIRQMFGLPVFAALSTSGMVGFEVPPHVKSLAIYPDGDIPTQMKSGGWNSPPGEAAARKLSIRLKEEGVSHVIEKPPVDGDFNDILIDARKKGLI